MEAGNGVLFLRKGRMPDVTGTWTDTSLIEEVEEVWELMGWCELPRFLTCRSLRETGEVVMRRYPSGLIPEFN